MDVDCAELHAPDLARLACVRDALRAMVAARDAPSLPFVACPSDAAPDLGTPWMKALCAAAAAATVSLASVWWATCGTWQRSQRCDSDASHERQR